MSVKNGSRKCTDNNCIYTGVLFKWFASILDPKDWCVKASFSFNIIDSNFLSSGRLKSFKKMDENFRKNQNTDCQEMAKIWPQTTRIWLKPGTNCWKKYLKPGHKLQWNGWNLDTTVRKWFKPRHKLQEMA